MPVLKINDLKTTRDKNHGLGWRKKPVAWDDGMG